MLKPVNTDPVSLYLESLPAASSRRTMRASLNTVAGILSDTNDATKLEWGQLTYAHTVALRAELLRRYKGTTVNKFLAGYRCVLKAAWRLGLMDSEAYRRASDVVDVPVTKEKSGRYVPKEEIRKLYEVCRRDASPMGLRDLAMIHLLRNSGMRRAELADLSIADLDLDSRSVRIGAGKNNAYRAVYLPDHTCQVLRQWLDLYQPPTSENPLFVRAIRGGHLSKYRIAGQAAAVVLKSRAEQAGIEMLTPHDLRRSYISDLFDQGVDVATIAKIVGHTDITITITYDRRQAAPAQRAANLIGIDDEE